MKVANVALRGMNVYGIRLHDWLEDRRPDIVTLQKIGLDGEFPTNALGEVGYESRFVGNRSGNSPTGVAVMSHRDLGRPEVLYRGLPGDRGKESDFLTVEVGGIWVSSVYVPYAPKGRLAWLRRLRDHV